MDINSITELIRMMEASRLTALEIEQDGLRVRMEQSAWRGEAAPAVPPEAAAPPREPSVESADAPLTGVNIREITAPMVGVFHALKKPVAMGDIVEKGQPVCIIEAMKLMNEIVSDHSGQVAWIAAHEGDMVEYGQLLMQIKEDA